MVYSESCRRFDVEATAPTHCSSRKTAANVKITNIGSCRRFRSFRPLAIAFTFLLQHAVLIYDCSWTTFRVVVAATRADRRRETASAALRDGSASPSLSDTFSSSPRRKGQLYPPPLRLISKEDADMEFEGTKELLLETLTGKRAYERGKVHNALAVSVDHIILQTKKFLADPAFHTRTKLAVDVCGEGSSFPVIPGSRRRCDYVYVFGDVHGAIDDLIQVLANLPDKSFWTEEGRGQIVFLGDYGDRAPTKGDSWFTLLFMMYLQSTFPDRVLLLRGNHETKSFMGQFMLRRCVPRPTAKPSTSADKAREAFAASLMFGESGPCPVYDQGSDGKARNLEKVSEAVKKYVLEDSVNLKTGYTDPAWFSLLPQMAVVFGKTLLVHGGVSQDLKSVAELRTVDLRKLSTNKNKARLADRFFDNCAESACTVGGTKWRKEDLFYSSEELEPLGIVPEIWRDRELPKTLARRLRRMDAPKADELVFWCSNELLMADPSPGVEGLRMLPLIEMTLSLLDVEGPGAASSSASVSAPARTNLQEQELKRAVQGSLDVLSRIQRAISEKTWEPAEHSEVMKRVEEMEQLLAAKVDSTTRADLKRKVVDIIDAAFPTEEENEPAVQQDAMMSDLGLRLRLHLRFRVDAAAVERLRTEYKKMDAVLDHFEDYRCPGAFSAEAANAYLEGNGLESIIRGHQPDTTARKVVNFRYDLFPRLPLISGKGAASIPTAAGGGELKSKVMFVFSSPYYGPRRRVNPTFGSFVKLQRKRTSSPLDDDDDDDDDAEKDGPPLKRARRTSPAVPAPVEAAFFVDKVAWQKKTTYEDFSEPVQQNLTPSKRATTNFMVLAAQKVESIPLASSVTSAARMKQASTTTSPPTWNHLSVPRELAEQESATNAMREELKKAPDNTSVVPTVYLFGRGPLAPNHGGPAPPSHEGPSTSAPDPWTWLPKSAGGYTILA